MNVVTEPYVKLLLISTIYRITLFHLPRSEYHCTRGSWFNLTERSVSLVWQKSEILTPPPTLTRLSGLNQVQMSKHNSYLLKWYSHKTYALSALNVVSGKLKTSTPPNTLTDMHTDSAPVCTSYILAIGLIYFVYIKVFDWWWTDAFDHKHEHVYDLSFDTISDVWA